MRIFSFSLWGQNPVYTVGCIKNVQLINKYFPSWYIYIFLEKNIYDFIKDSLKFYKQIKYVVCPNVQESDSTGMFWRFLPISKWKFEYVAIRDTDSRVSPREVHAICDWISSGADVHIMRDHPYHSAPIMGGMWGIKGGKYNNLEMDIENFKPTTSKGQDQEFLKLHVYKKIQQGKLSSKVHDPFFEKKPFPRHSKRGLENENIDFVGQCFNEHDKRNSDADALMVYQYEQRQNE